MSVHTQWKLRIVCFGRVCHLIWHCFLGFSTLYTNSDFSPLCFPSKKKASTQLAPEISFIMFWAFGCTGQRMWLRLVAAVTLEDWLVGQYGISLGNSTSPCSFYLSSQPVGKSLSCVIWDFKNECRRWRCAFGSQLGPDGSWHVPEKLCLKVNQWHFVIFDFWIRQTR